MNNKNHNLFIITGPSGAGEDSVISGLKKYIDFVIPITTTTRSMRQGESQGEPYYFISKTEFQEDINNNKFFEYALEDGGNYYGVTNDEITRIFNLNKIIIWKVDWQGVLFIKKKFSQAKSIFLNIPLEIVEKRIRHRDNVSDEFVQGRMKYAQGWYDNKDKFDFIVDNEEGKLSETIEKVANIIKKMANID